MNVSTILYWKKTPCVYSYFNKLQTYLKTEIDQTWNGLCIPPKQENPILLGYAHFLFRQCYTIRMREVFWLWICLDASLAHCGEVPVTQVPNKVKISNSTENYLVWIFRYPPFYEHNQILTSQIVYQIKKKLKK